MAQVKAKELKDLTVDELKEKLAGRKKELFSLRLQAKLGKLEKHSTVKMTKKEIARTMTILRQKEPS